MIKLFDKSADQLRAEAQSHEDKARDLRTQATAKRREEQLAKPLFERLRFAAVDKCACGAGMAYDPTGDDVFSRPTKWECSDIIRFETLSAERQAEVKSATHTGALPFAFYELKGEGQPSAHGATTRPQPGDPRAE